MPRLLPAPIVHNVKHGDHEGEELHTRHGWKSNQRCRCQGRHRSMHKFWLWGRRMRICAACEVRRWHGRLSGCRGRRVSRRQSGSCWELDACGIQTCCPGLNRHIPGVAARRSWPTSAWSLALSEQPYVLDIIWREKPGNSHLAKLSGAPFSDIKENPSTNGSQKDIT